MFTDPTFPPDRSSLIWDKYVGDDKDMFESYKYLSKPNGEWMRAPNLPGSKSLWGTTGIRPAGVK